MPAQLPIDAAISAIRALGAPVSYRGSEPGPGGTTMEWELEVRFTSPPARRWWHDTMFDWRWQRNAGA